MAKKPAPDYIDAVAAAADHYTLLSQEGAARVIKMHLPAGAKDNLHSHNNETVYFLQGGKAKIHVVDH
jgi:quercetin dioxygenase-like cupin family protein